MKFTHSVKIVLLLSLVAPIFFGCQPREDGKKTRLRPDMRRKQDLKTLNDAKGATKKTEKTTATTPEEEKLLADKNPLEITSPRCRLYISDSDKTADTGFPSPDVNNNVETRDNNTIAKAELYLCDAIYVQPSEDGSFQITTTENLENVSSGLEVKKTDVKRYNQISYNETALDPKGVFFSIDIKSKKGQNVDSGRDILYLSYVLPWKKSDMDMTKLVVNLEGQDLRLSEKEDVADVLVSEWTGRVVVRIKNFQLIKNINFKIQIRGAVLPTAVMVDAPVEAITKKGAGATSAEERARRNKTSGTNSTTKPKNSMLKNQTGIAEEML